MTYQTIKFAVANAVATITLDRPDKLNACTPEMADEMRHALANCDDSRCILIKGEGRAFCSGADLSAIVAGGDAGEGAYESLTGHFHPLIEDIVSHELPVVAQVHGAAAGIGCSLALACDFCVAAEDGYFLLAFANIGLVPDGGASWLLPRLAGRARAAEMLMLGENIPAAKAEQWGLIYKCVPDRLLADEVTALTTRLAMGPTKALGMMKRNLDLALNHSLAATMQAEAEAQRDAAGTHDAKEGIGAFLQKRKPRFKGE